MSALEWAGALALLAAFWLTGRVAYRRGYHMGYQHGGSDEIARNLAAGRRINDWWNNRRSEPEFARGPERAQERMTPGSDVAP